MKILYSFSLFQVLIAMMLAFIIIQMQSFWLDIDKTKENQRIINNKILEPSSNWMVINSIHVPDFNIGENPIITVKRKIKKSFIGEWTVELQKITGKKVETECYGSGRNQYKMNDNLPKKLTLGWWMNDEPDTPPCIKRLIPGDYKLCTVYIIKPKNYPDKYIDYCTKKFKISDKKLDK